jgi:cytochrome b6-f complex iron-sulfur subunit
MAENDAFSSRSGGGEIDRRGFLNGITTTALGIAAVGASILTVRYLSPNALFEPPTSFRIGAPDSYPVNSVTYLADQEVYIVRTALGFVAESAICTHLGCITQWKPELGLISCPCHGSRFNKDGTVAHGPAPRALPHFAVRLLADGDLLVDKLDTVPESQILKV